jgi:hypothetical protein
MHYTHTFVAASRIFAVFATEGSPERLPREAASKARMILIVHAGAHHRHNQKSTTNYVRMYIDFIECEVVE